MDGGGFRQIWESWQINFLHHQIPQFTLISYGVGARYNKGKFTVLDEVSVVVLSSPFLWYGTLVVTILL